MRKRNPNEMKVQRIEEHLTQVEKHLANAEEYVAKNVNVEGSSFLHFRDWEGKSGHPLWMKNHMIPTTKKHRAKKEKVLESVKNKVKERTRTQRRRDGQARKSQISSNE